MSLKYVNYADVFSPDLVMKLLEYTDINDHIIKQKKDKQLLYNLIYNVGLIKLETLKTYIKTYLKTKFIQSFKFYAGAYIFFDQNQMVASTSVLITKVLII